MLTRMRNKSSRTKSGCILCYNMGAARKTYAYIHIKFPRHPQSKLEVEKEIGLCFTHCRARSESQKAGILDPEFGLWRHPFTGAIKEGGGGVPIRDEVYVLLNNDVSLLTGPSGKIPLWW